MINVVQMNAITIKLLYVPNLIGYFRAFCLVAGLLVLQKDPLAAWGLWVVCGFLDAADGFFARLLNQTTQFGAMLDYTIDRALAACGYFAIALFYPHLWAPCVILCNLDILAHYFHLKCTHILNNTNHKAIHINDYRIVKFYYSTKPVLFSICFFHDMFLALVLLYKLYPNSLVLSGLILFFPGFLFKICVHVMKMIRAASIILVEH